MKAEMLFEVIVIHSFAAFQTRDLSLGFIIVENWTNFYRSDPAVTVTSERRLLTSNLSSSSSLEHSRECVHEREGLCVWVRAHERVGKRERVRERKLFTSKAMRENQNTRYLSWQQQMATNSGKHYSCQWKPKNFIISKNCYFTGEF